MFKPCIDCGTPIKARRGLKRCEPCSADRLTMPEALRAAAIAIVEDRTIPVPHSGCWIWTGLLDRDGYGRISFGRWRIVAAHRFSFLAHHGAIPVGGHICHRCDVRPCVNPDHLYAGTNLDNIRDRVARGRSRAGRTCLGATYVARTNKWQAQIMRRGRAHYLGQFETQSLAVAAYQAADAKLRGV